MPEKNGWKFRDHEVHEQQSELAPLNPKGKS
jgi:hypothetical protein